MQPFQLAKAMATTMIRRTLREYEGREVQERDLDLTGQDRVMDLDFGLLLMVDVFW